MNFKIEHSAGTIEQDCSFSNSVLAVLLSQPKSTCVNLQTNTCPPNSSSRAAAWRIWDSQFFSPHLYEHSTISTESADAVAVGVNATFGQLDGVRAYTGDKRPPLPEQLPLRRCCW